MFDILLNTESTTIGLCNFYEEDSLKTRFSFGVKGV